MTNLNVLDNTNTPLGVAGDWHGNQDWAVRALTAFHTNGINVILHVGDFGFWNHQTSGQDYLTCVNDMLEQFDMVLIVTPGNHENYVQLSTFQPVPGRSGFVYDQDFPNILVSVRGARWEWDNTSFVFLGGANSIDRQGRIEGVSWWAGEQITLGDVYRTVEGGHAEVMVCHDCPTGVNLFGNHRDSDNGWSMAALAYAQQSRDSLRQAVDGVKPKVLFHGHYHRYLDVETVMNDGLDDYTIRTVGLDMDDSDANIGIFIPSTGEFTLLNVPALSV